MLVGFGGGENKVHNGLVHWQKLMVYFFGIVGNLQKPDQDEIKISPGWWLNPQFVVVVN